MTQSTFDDLGLIEPLLRAVREEGYTTPTPIQIEAIPHLLAGKDLMGCAQTGTGKTAAFALPMLQRLQAGRRASGSRFVRALVLAPTRELATQIGDSFTAYGRHVKLSSAVIYGGVGQKPQVQALARGLDVLVATPGRLLDLIGQGHVMLPRLEILVLDEADRMLDMGFINDIRKILSHLPKVRQNLLFSATIPQEIVKLAESILTDPVRVAVAPQATTADKVTQWVVHVERAGKRALLEQVLRTPAIGRALVFTRTKHGANRLAEQLDRGGFRAEVIHSDKAQGARERALDAFRTGRTKILVATDIAARGIDIDDISHVVNYDLPNIAESYVHRIGRTARAGAAGIAISFCDSAEKPYLKDIEGFIRRKIPVADTQRLNRMASGEAQPNNGASAGDTRTGPPARAAQGAPRAPAHLPKVLPPAPAQAPRQRAVSSRGGHGWM
jgi:ATP-dependent RNA helicase RhlE